VYFARGFAVCKEGYEVSGRERGVLRPHLSLWASERRGSTPRPEAGSRPRSWRPPERESYRSRRRSYGT